MTQDGERDQQARHALTHLTRLAKRVPQQRALLESALRGRLPLLAKAAIDVALETGDPMGEALAGVFRDEGSGELAEQLHDLVPAETTSLRELAVDVTRLVVQAQLAREPLANRAIAVVHNYAQRLVAIGELEQAYDVARETQAMLAKRPPDARDPRLAISLARVHADTGHFGEAVELLSESLPTLRSRATGGGAEEVADLAFALHNLGASASEVGRIQEAKTALAEALRIRQRLAKDGSNDATLEVAETLLVAAAVESEGGDRRKSTRWTERAVAMLEPLADRMPDTHRQLFARALQNQASMYHDLGEFARSEELGLQAAELVSDLAEGRNQAFGRLYVSVLRTIANAALAQERWPSAFEAAARAEAIASALTPPGHTARLESLAEALAIKGAALRGWGRTTEAAVVLKACLDIRRTLAQADPRRYTMALVRALNNFANGVGWNAVPEQALACAREAVVLQEQRRAMMPRPDATLAATFDTLGCRLAVFLMHRAALRQTMRACLALTRPFQQYPERYADWMHRFVGHVEALRWRVPGGVAVAAMSRLRSRVAQGALGGPQIVLGREERKQVDRVLGRIDLVTDLPRGEGKRRAMRERMRAVRKPTGG